MRTRATQLGWVPIYGEFDLSGGSIIFRGKRIGLPAHAEAPEAEVTEQVSLGLLLSSSSITDGRLSAEIEFETVKPETACEFAVSYNTNPQHFVSI